MEIHDVLFHPSFDLSLQLLLSPWFLSFLLIMSRVFFSFFSLCLIYCWILFLNCGSMYSLDLCGHVDVLYDAVRLIDHCLISPFNSPAVPSSCIITCNTQPR